jgi:spore coat protein U-like protein
MRKVISASLAIAALAAAGTASALSTNASFNVTATVLMTCSATASTLGFGNYTPGTGGLTANTTVNVKCTKGTGFTVALDKGTTATGTVAQRLMTNGTDTLQYNLYTTSGFATIFGDTAGLTQAGIGTGLANNVPFTVYGRLLDSVANQAVAPGSYTDTIGVVVTY